MVFFSFQLVFCSVLLASYASILCSDTDSGLTFAAKVTNKGATDNHTLVNEFNMEYTGKVNVGGQDFTVIIDTGSSDLWVTSGEKIKLNGATNTSVNLTYGLGSAYGNISYASVSFGGYQVDNQAFLIASKTTDQDAQGILGLGLDGLSVIERTAKNEPAQSVMANMFAQHPSTLHLIGLALERTVDGEDTAGGLLTIGEYDPKFHDVTRTPKIPLSPPSTSRWTIAIEGMEIDGNGYSLKSAVRGSNPGQAIALIDSGTSLAYIPNDLVHAIYSHIPGSVHVKTTSQDAWFVPCLAKTNLSFTFANINYAINPMDLTSPMRVVNQNNQYTVCVNAFRPPLNGTDHAFDFLLGDVFMRNVYVVFNFGNVSAQGEDPHGDAKNASIQLLPRTNRNQVYSNFVRTRKESLRGYPPLFDLSKLHSDGTTDDGERLGPPPED